MAEFNLKEALSRQTDSSLMLARHIIVTEAKDKNFVFSPVSINIVLSMVAAGSKDQTLNEFLTFLKSKNLDELGKLVNTVVSDLLADGVGEDDPKLALANGIWIRENLKIKEKFRQVVLKVYNGHVKKINSCAEYKDIVREVNEWAEEKTNGRIKDIIPSSDDLDGKETTMLILANAIHFRGLWMVPFEPHWTKGRPFHLLSGIDVEVPFMSNMAMYQNVAEYDGFKVLGLPYQCWNPRKFSMYFFLPDAKDGLPALVEKLDSGSAFLDKHIPKGAEKIGELRIPKFKITYGFEAKKVLEDLGLVSVFTTPNDLTEMTDSLGEKLFVSKAHHKAFIEIHEDGTEAAATTVFEADDMGFNFDDVKKIDFVADHPFLFIIRENVSGLVLFVGQVLNPLET